MSDKDLAYTCMDCGSVKWNLLQDMTIECAGCQSKFLGVMWSTDVDFKHGRLAALREVREIVKRNRDEWGGGDWYDAHDKDIEDIDAMITKEER